MGRFLRNTVFVFMAIAMLYVLVSPLVPTPNAVGKNAHSQVVVIAPLMALAANLVAPHRSADAIPDAELPAIEVLALTCTRLC